MKILRKFPTILIQVCFLLFMLFGWFFDTEAATFVVNTTDTSYDGRCDATHCSIYDAVHLSNRRPDPDTITFNISGAGPHVIPIPDGVEYWLQLIAGQTTIDGTSQPGYSGVPLIVLESAGAHHAALELWSDNNIIRGLAFVGFRPESYT